jgi:hypothetical protein
MDNVSGDGYAGEKERAAMRRAPLPRLFPAIVLTLAAAMPAYAHDPTPLLPFFALGLLVTGAAAAGTKYVVGGFFHDEMRTKRARLFFFVGFCELAALVVATLASAGVIESIALDPEVNEELIWWVAVSLVYSLLIVFPNALLLRSEQASTVRVVLASGGNIVRAWLLGLFLPVALAVVWLFLMLAFG